MITLYWGSYEPFHITIPKTYIIYKVLSLYNCQYLNLVNEKICVGNGRFFYFNGYGKLELFYM